MAAPSLVSASASGATLTLTFDSGLDRTVTLNLGGFSVSPGHGQGGTFSVISAQFDAIDSRVLTLNLSSAVSQGQFVTLSYNDPTDNADDANVLQSAANPADDVADFSVVASNGAPDTTAPQVAISADDTLLKLGETARITLTFTEAPVGFAASDVVATGGEVSAFQATSDARIYTAVFTPTVEGGASVAVAAGSYTDAAGNPGEGDVETLTFDATKPLVSLSLQNATVGVGQAATVIFTFTEPPVGFTIDDIAASNGATVSGLTATADPLVFAAAVTPTTTGTVVVGVTDLSFSDAAGNAGSGATTILNVTSSPAPVTPLDTDDVIYASLGATGIVQGGGGDDQIFGSTGADTLQGNTGNDTILGGAGDDVLLGGQGEDLVQGNTGADLVFGNFGNDTAHGGQGNDLVQGNEGADVVFGDLGDDTVHGGQGDDLVFGGDGADLVFGDLGDDTLTGGAGADQFWFPDGAGGLDTITDFSHSDGDRIVLGTQFAADFAALSSHLGSAANGDAVISFGGLVITLTGVAASSLTAADFLFV